MATGEVAGGRGSVIGGFEVWRHVALEAGRPQRPRAAGESDRQLRAAACAAQDPRGFIPRVNQIVCYESSCPNTTRHPKSVPDAARRPIDQERTQRFDLFAENHREGHRLGRGVSPSVAPSNKVAPTEAQPSQRNNAIGPVRCPHTPPNIGEKDGRPRARPRCVLVGFMGEGSRSPGWRGSWGSARALAARARAFRGPRVPPRLADDLCGLWGSPQGRWRRRPALV